MSIGLERTFTIYAIGKTDGRSVNQLNAGYLNDRLYIIEAECVNAI
jgi:hypothetical protein